jgi:hypothetical protein
MAWTLDHLPLVVRTSKQSQLHSHTRSAHFSYMRFMLAMLQDGKDPTQYTMRVHSYSSTWAVQGQDYEAVSYSFPPLRCAVASCLPYSSTFFAFDRPGIVQVPLQ